MTTFELSEVRDFVTGLDTRMLRCQNGEGMECATLDATLRHHAGLCCEFLEAVRAWGRAIFAGRASCDPDVESIWIQEGERLYSRAVEMHTLGQRSEGPCYLLEGKDHLGAAGWSLYRLLKEWVTPQLSAGPSARQGLALTGAAAEEAGRRILELPPLPAEWQPTDSRLRAWYRMSRNP